MGEPGQMSIDQNTMPTTSITEKPRREKGFTLIEVLIAITLLAIGLMAVATMQVSAIHGNKTGGDISNATFLAQDKLEELKTSADITGESNGSDQAGVFTRNWQITPSGANSCSVTVTVSWVMGGNSHSVAISTISRGNGY